MATVSTNLAACNSPPRLPVWQPRSLAAHGAQLGPANVLGSIRTAVATFPDPNPYPDSGWGRSWGRKTYRIKKLLVIKYLNYNIGGRGGIRTHGGLAPTAVFKTAALNHSATLPSDASLFRAPSMAYLLSKAVGRSPSTCNGHVTGGGQGTPHHVTQTRHGVEKRGISGSNRPIRCAGLTRRASFAAKSRFWRPGVAENPFKVLPRLGSRVASHAGSARLD